MTNVSKLVLRGIVPPLLTPLTAPDELDRPGLARLIEHVLAGGVSGLFVLGTTGEGPGLSYRLREELVAATVELTAGRVPVLVGVTDTSLTEAVRLSESARSAGATAVVTAPPYYFPMPLRDVQRFWLELSDRSPLPVYVYNMPSCTGVNVTPAVVEACAAHPNIVGVKDSSGDMALFREFVDLRRFRPDWSFFVGPEHLLQDAVAAGGDGGVNGGANLAPNLFARWFQACDAGRWSDAESLRQTVLDLGRIYDVGGDFISVTRSLKCALSQLGICRDVMTEPFRSYNDEQASLVARFVRESLDDSTRPRVFQVGYASA